MLHSVSTPANLENSAVATGLEKFSFYSDFKNGSAKECSNYHTIVLIPHASKVMLKILQARLQQYVNQELTDIQTGFWKGRWTRDQIANIYQIIEKVREFQKNIYCFIDYVKVFDCVDHSKLWKILRNGVTRPPYLPPKKPICRSRKIVPDMEQWTGFKIGKGVRQGCILSSCLFNLRAVYFMWNARLDDA